MTRLPPAAELAPAIIRFWFEEVGEDRWFAKDPALDSEIRRRFGAFREALLSTRASGWRDKPEHLLAAIIMLDQFSRNIHRGSARAFEADELALELCRLALHRGWVADAPDEWRQFFLMPLQHSEKLEDQLRSVEEFRRAGNALGLRYALLHLDQIRRFGRFPGRNLALGRLSTPEELAVIERGETF
ncbi:MAG: DUF924 domain-containing protein [Sphingomonas sp.]|nr:DUF924 domain-containing protein [Sphingomonas sp.]